jgi:hypothetical protein
MKRYFPIFLAGILVSVGTYWSFERGGHDFLVFYDAWKLVILGRGAEIYVNSPDRYLYSPGFAWLLAPIGLIPVSTALALWCLAKASVVYWMIQTLAAKIYRASRQSAAPVSVDGALAIASAGFVLVARPFLIEFQYGQINTFILAISLWALLSFYEAEENPDSASKLWLPWFSLGLIAAAKIFPLPLLLFPYFRKEGNKPNSVAKSASLLGIVTAWFLPVITEGPRGAAVLLMAWRDALIGKGLPFETHNQSFIAMLHHYFTTEPTHVIALGANPVVFGSEFLHLGPARIAEISLAWSFLVVGILLAWIIHSKKVDPFKWVAVALGLIFIPSYLVWKPYFVLTYPLAVLMIWRYRSKKWLIVAGFTAMNLTGFDLLGGVWAARLEGASVFLIVHLSFLACALWGKPDFTIKHPASLDTYA